MHVQGGRSACDRLIDDCRRGPRAGRVDRVEVVRAPHDATLSGYAVLRSQ
jgi:hypothetical protein